MTRWAFVSDIHGNLNALEQAERIAGGRGVDRFICLGDVIGRGDPAGCVEWVRATTDHAIIGNRDLDYIDRIEPKLQSVVRSWANEVRAAEFIASHGEPRLHRVLSSAAERDGFQRARKYMLERGARVWFFGHTHRSRAWELSENGARALVAKHVHFDGDLLYVVNVGTTGLRLPGRGPAAFVLYDDKADSVEHVMLGPTVKMGRQAPRSAVRV